MAYIKINSKYPLYDGMPITFKAPCDCTGAEGLTVNSTNFIFKDAHGNALTGIGNLFGKDALVKVILDKTNGFAYIQNADSNKYLEDRMSAAEAGISANSANINTNRTNIAANTANIEGNRKSIGSLDSRADRTEKRVATLEAVVYGDLAQETEDNTVAYTKDVPANARGTAKLNTLGGMTRKCSNLFKCNDTVFGRDGWFEADNNGLRINQYRDTGKYTFTAENGKLNITAYNNEGYRWLARFVKLTPDTMYTLSAVSSTLQGAVIGLNSDELLTEGTSVVNNFYGAGDGITFNSGNYKYWMIVFYSMGAGEFMLNEGSTALPYEPYFEGLRSAPTEKVESVGVNLLKLAEKSETRSGVTLTASADSITLNGTATADVYFNVDVVELAKGTYALSCQNAVSWANRLLYCEEEATWTADAATAVHSWKGGMCNFMIYVASGTTNSNVTLFPMLNKGTTAQPYRPYQRNTLPIPEAVRPAHGINENVYDYIEWCEDETRKSYKRVGKVDLGTLYWNKGESVDGNTYYAIISGMQSARTDSERVTGWLCEKYNASSSLSTSNLDNKSALRYTSNSTFFVRDDEYTDAATFKSAMSGVMLYYELATPEVTDISDILPADNYIGVEGGGTLTFKNEYEYDVPSEVTYITKGATV